MRLEVYRVLVLILAIRFLINSLTLSSSSLGTFYSFSFRYLNRALAIIFFFLEIYLILKFYISITSSYLFIIVLEISTKEQLSYTIRV
jgi:hypothetical protein